MRLLGRRGGDGRPAWRLPPGVVATGLDQAALDELLDGLGEAGQRARRLDRAVEAAMPEAASFSPLTSTLAEEYLDRIGHALKQLTLESGVFVTTRGYLAHQLVEADPAAYGAADVPVLGTLPPLRGGRPPAGLPNRLVRATRRGFEHIRAVDAATWDGYVAATTWRAHRRGEAAPAPSPDGDAGYVDPAVVDALVRYGWVLRQVDLHYAA